MQREAEISKAVWQAALKRDREQLKAVQEMIMDLRDGKSVKNLSLLDALDVERDLENSIKKKERLLSKLASGEPMSNPVEAFKRALEEHTIASRCAMEHPSEEAKSKYLKDHPKADASKHWVKGEKSKEQKRKDKYDRDSALINKKIDKEEAAARKKKEDAAKREERAKRESEKEDKRIQKERDWAAGKEERDRKKKEKYDRDVARRNKQLDKEEAKAKKRQKSASQIFQEALLVQRVADRFERTVSAASPKAFIGNVGGTNYAIKIDGIDSSFLHQPFGRQLDEWNKIKEWKQGAKKDHVRAKGKATLAAVKTWVKENNPKEFFAKWKPDSSNHKDDTVEILYKA